VTWDLGGEGERKKFCDAMWGWGHCVHCLHLHDGLLAAMMRNGFPFGAPGLERTFLFFSFLLFQIRMGWNVMPSFLVQYQYQYVLVFVRTEFFSSNKPHMLLPLSTQSCSCHTDVEVTVS